MLLELGSVLLNLISETKRKTIISILFSMLIVIIIPIYTGFERN